MSKRSHDEVAGAGQMTVLATRSFGRRNLEFIQDHPIPKLNTTDVLIRVLYSDLNPVDHHKVR